MAKVEAESGTIHTAILESARKYPGRTAIIWKEYSVTYDELALIAARVTKHLRRPGHVGICIENPIHFCMVYLGILMKGGVVAPIRFNSTEFEVKRQLLNSDCEFLITDRRFSGFITTIFSNAETIDELGDVFLLERTIPDFQFRPDGTALLFQTSGTTGNPKIAQLSHNGIVTIAEAHNTRLQLLPEHTVLQILPITSSYAHVTQFISQLIIGGTLVVYNRPFVPGEIYRIIATHNVYSVGLVPPHIKLMNKYPPVPEIVSSLHIAVCAGGPVPRSDLLAIGKYFPKTAFVRAYGLTEAGPRVTCSTPFAPTGDHAGTPLDGVTVQIRLSNRVCDVFEIGEIWVKSPGNMIGYYKNPQMTSKVLVDGWLSTGDLGYLNEENELTIVGRIKNTMLVGGFTVYPEEIEEFLVGLPQVVDSAVVPDSDQLMGQIPIAFVVLREHDGGEIDEIQSECKSHLLPYKVPRRFIAIESIPRNSNGKIDRIKLIHELSRYSLNTPRGIPANAYDDRM